MEAEEEPWGTASWGYTEEEKPAKNKEGRRWPYLEVLGERISGSREQIAASGTQGALVTGDHSEKSFYKVVGMEAQGRGEWNKWQ